MRQTQIFSGSSHPQLAHSICDWLGQKLGEADLGKFANGETMVQIRTSVRNKDVFIVQSGSNRINDSVIELLIMCSACKGGSAKSITAVMPYFPYSRQSKKKSHRGAITARMIANLLNVSGVDHVITIDLHATQMQGFFECPVDNLPAEPLLARWIKHNVEDWKDGVVVSKNPGGTKRATSLADRLKLNFGIVTTESRRPVFFDMQASGTFENDQDSKLSSNEALSPPQSLGRPSPPSRPTTWRRTTAQGLAGTVNNQFSPTPRSTLPDSPHTGSSPGPLARVRTDPLVPLSLGDAFGEDAYVGERARDVITGRFVSGQMVDDDSYPSPAFSAYGGGPGLAQRSRGLSSLDEADVPMDALAHSTTFSIASSSLRQPHPSVGGGDGDTSAVQRALGGSIDAAASDEEEEAGLRDPGVETTVTLVGDVRDRPVFVVDDICDRPASWIAAAETVVRRGGATKVFCMATHGVFTEDALAELLACESIDRVVVTSSFPIEAQHEKLVVLDVAPLLSEAIRRFHHGENIGQLYSLFAD